jgi:hypothetical protein
MKRITYSFLIIILFSFSETIQSQNVSKDYDQVYGLDQTLCNGKKYNYFATPGTSGHQYLLSPGFETGSVTLKGKIYQDIILNFDIFNQQLLLQFSDGTGKVNIIEVSQAWLQGFRLGKRNFELLTLEKDPCFYQVLGEAPVRILYYWRKSLNLSNTIGTSNYVFSAAVRDSFVLMDGKLKPFNSKRSLIRLFEAGHRQEIKSYIRKHKIRIRKASDQVMGEMITYIGHLR